MAIDQKAILDAVYLGAGQAAKNLIPPTMWSYNDAVQPYPHDPDAAKKLLADAGYPNGFETDLWAMPVQRPYNPDARRIAELMQSDLAKIGVKAKIVSFEWGEYRKRVAAGEHQMAELGWTGDNGDPDNFFGPLAGCAAARPGGGNAAKWCNKQFDDLITKAVDPHRPGRPRQALRTGAGDHARGGAVLPDRAFRRLPADAQGGDRLRDEPVRPPRFRARRPAVSSAAAARAGRDVLRLLARRLALIVPTFVGVTLLGFLLIHAIPGDPVEVRAGERGIAPERLAYLRHELGLDQPLWKQFLDYEGQLLQGDLGRSVVTQESVWTEFKTFFPATVELGVCALVFAIVDRPAARRAGRGAARFGDRLRPDRPLRHRRLDADLLVGADGGADLLRRPRLDPGLRPHRRPLLRRALDRLPADR